MPTQQLFISFWSIALGNLPEGNITHRRIQASEARRRIEEARKIIRHYLQRRATAPKRIGVGYQVRELSDPCRWIDIACPSC